MNTGKVKWFNGNKGYGFIEQEGGGGDVFVHISEVENAGLRTLDENQRVSYDIEKNKGKSSATNLKLL
ncbi:cold-shock protein [Rickettsiaceae bacterium]|nr:cold-shock protein [Rickettsiaceae bacterium]